MSGMAEKTAVASLMLISLMVGFALGNFLFGTMAGAIGAACGLMGCVYGVRAAWAHVFRRGDDAAQSNQS